MSIGNKLVMCLGLILIHQSFNLNADPGSPIGTSTIHYSLDSCHAYVLAGTVRDYSEFTGEITNEGNCQALTPVSTIYRRNPDVNKHSCTEGIDGTLGMCINSLDDCNFQSSNSKALRFEVLVTPQADGITHFDNLNFYEQAPENYNWVDGPSGPNNYPIYYALRISKNGQEILLIEDILTARTWSLQSFDFSDNEEFRVDLPSLFEFELLPYCLAGIDTEVSAWDIDEIFVTASCYEDPLTNPLISFIDGDSTKTFCGTDGISDFFEINLLPSNADESVWVVTDADNNILLIDTSSLIDFEQFSIGECQLYNLAYTGTIQGLSIGSNLSNLLGCYALSNALLLSHLVIESKSIITSSGQTSVEFCLEAGSVEIVQAIANTDSSSSCTYLLTDTNGFIVEEQSDGVFEFSTSRIGSYLIYNLNYLVRPSNLLLGANVTDLIGCYGVSNTISVQSRFSNGGVISFNGEEVVEYCSGSSNSAIFTPELVGNVGIGSFWLITDNNGIIARIAMSLPLDVSALSLDTCKVYHLAFDGNLAGLISGASINQISGCYNLSNAITIVKITKESPQIELQGSDNLLFCNQSASLTALTPSVTNSIQDSLLWVVTNVNDLIVSISSQLPLDLSNAANGIWKIYAVSYDGQLPNLQVGDLITQLNGDCITLSNAIIVNKYDLRAGDISVGGSTTVNICSNISNASILNVDVSNALDGENSVFIITDLNQNIIEIVSSTTIDVSQIAFDNFLIYRVTYAGFLSGLMVGNDLSSFTGCFDLSNSINVIRTSVTGGTLTTVTGTDNYNICVAPGDPVLIDLILNNNSSSFSSYIITDESNRILGLSDSAPVDMTFFGAGQFNIYHLASDGFVGGINLGDPITGLNGACFALSNSVRVNIAVINGGEISSDLGNNIDFCTSYLVSEPLRIHLANAEGLSSVWLLTDTLGNIIQYLSFPPIDLSGLQTGTCEIVHLSFSNNIMGLMPGNNLSQLQGCFDLSNSIIVNKRFYEGGTLTSNLGNDISLCNATELILDLSITGNTGSQNIIIHTDGSGNIVNIFNNSTGVTIDVSGIQNGLLWNVSSDENLSSISIGSNFFDLEGCFAVSNSISFENFIIPGGSINSNLGNDVILCSDITSSETISFTYSGTTTSQSEYIITNSSGTILRIENTGQINFDIIANDTCFVQHVNYSDTISSFSIGDNINSNSLCFSKSNSIRVVKQLIEGGVLTTSLGDSIVICNDDFSNAQIDIHLLGNTGQFNQLILTDENGTIIALPNSNVLDVSSIALSECLLYNLSFNNGLSGLGIGNNLNNIAGCYELSNSVIILKSVISGGVITSSQGNDVEVCKNEGVDTFIDFSVTGNTGDSSAWIRTDLSGNIISFIDELPFLIDDSGPSSFFVYHLAYSESITNLMVGNNINDFIGCSGISNGISVSVRTLIPYQISTSLGDSIFICNENNGILEIELDSKGGLSLFQNIVVTDILGMIVNPNVTNLLDLSLLIPGEYHIVHISYDELDDPISAGININNLTGCVVFSNTIYLSIDIKDAGTISGDIGLICVGDGEVNYFEPTVNGGQGSGLVSWLLTDTNGIILDIQNNLPINLENSTAGECLLWRICYDSTTLGVQLGLSIFEIQGCYDLSNSIVIHKESYSQPRYFNSMMWFDMNECYSDTKDDSNQDYSEFEAEIMNDTDCTQYELIGSNLYRNNPMINWHSCIEGYEGLAMCVSSLDSCEFVNNSELAVRFSVLMYPNRAGEGSLSALSFYEQSPETYNWVNGPDGENNYPTFYGIRILKDGEEIYKEIDVPTTGSWTLQEFNFEDLPEFYFNVPSVFEFEMLGYCLVGNESSVSAWDLDHIKISSSCSEGLIEPVIRFASGETFERICVDDQISDTLDINVLKDSGLNQTWVITDSNHEIIQYYETLPIVLDSLVPDSSLVWLINHLSFDKQSGSIDNLEGCLALSKPLLIVHADSTECSEIEVVIEDDGTRVESFNIHPNPSVDQITISLEATPLKGTQLIIYNRMGKALNVTTLTDKITDLDISRLDSGFYYAKIKSENWQTLRRFIKI